MNKVKDGYIQPPFTHGKRLIAILLGFLVLIAYTGCSNEPKEPLPVLGSINVPYTFTNQDGKPVSQALFTGTVYVADFFFTSCPTICPLMKSQMLRIYETFTAEDDVLLLSHSVDPEHDTVEVLNDYAKRLGISTTRWHMVTGPNARARRSGRAV